ncbi:hypothetical protein BZG36_04608 [Bifiguratus adelaidae]|uniref:CN hydrolase domain-containing protein n=1 Tax=Bifiguratus adelaidae TaxID=1938954 RepID=A0A261XXI0_9FUNG|nr:hypothetical protein BZG36_04608 [Bifiguratus adelaidae]
MKLACCQFAPVRGQVLLNQEKVDKLLAKYDPGDIDVLVLPEMAFSGYVFKSLNDIMPLLEDAETGPTCMWAKRQAKRLHCFVQVGFPQVIIEGADTGYFNAVVVVDRQGKLIKTYQKHFLYETDENWAQEGPGFSTYDIEGVKVAPAICMDINPKGFKDFYAFEFANFHVKEESQMILCSMNWIDSKKERTGAADTGNGSGSEAAVKSIPSADRSSDQFEEEIEQFSASNLNYWMLRLWPLYGETLIKADETVAMQRNGHGEKMYFVASNRTGTEEGY